MNRLFLACTPLFLWISLDLRSHGVDALLVSEQNQAFHPGRGALKELKSVLFMVQATPSTETASFSSDEFAKRPRPRTRGSTPSSMDTFLNEWQRSEKIEDQMVRALESLQGAMAAVETSPGSSSSTEQSSPIISGLLFPSVRECNAALATFGDAGELLRALRLFMRMRKAALLAKHFQAKKGWSWPVPSPTLVTYSTIMSRANRMGKSRVALRMWKLMQSSPEFVCNLGSQSEQKQHQQLPPDTIIPDIRAANILLNSFAKLADIESAQDLLNQMVHGNGTDVPGLRPNLITYNTLMNACHKAGDLDAAMAVLEQIEQSGLKPDARSYTSLIATVARKTSTASGANDPSLAFSFLADMNARDIRPNGMTYSALIDVCGRCGRSDLALKGLRIMLRQKSLEQEALANSDDNDNTKTSQRVSNYKGKAENYNLSNEVGAWTAAINACGKAGRVGAAVQLFFAMPNFGVKPNTITCGCLTDSLLKAGRLADTLKVLRYMDENAIAPSEVMYTSLMSSAGNLAKLERRNEKLLTADLDEEENRQNTNVNSTASCGAIEVYTVLMKSIMDGKSKDPNERKELSDRDIHDSSAQTLVKVFLVFQEMKDVGARPDIACYNALLKACARAGDIDRAQSVLRQLQEDSLEPNDTSWRQLIRAAGNAKRCDIAISTWRAAMDYCHDIKSHLGSDHSQFSNSQWKPSVESFSTLISVFVRSAADPTLDVFERKQLYHDVISMYKRVLSGNKDEELGLHRVDSVALLENSRALLLILQAIVSLEDLLRKNSVSTIETYTETLKLKQLASEILQLDVLEHITASQRLSRAAFWSIRKAQSWMEGSKRGEALGP